MKRTHNYSLRLSDEEFDKLQYLIHQTEIKPSKLFRDTLNYAYDAAYKQEPTEAEIQFAKNLTPALLTLTTYLKGMNNNE